MFLVIVDNFHLVSIALAPDKTGAELVVDPDTVLSFAIAFERFQTIPRWNP